MRLALGFVKLVQDDVGSACAWNKLCWLCEKSVQARKC